jgi:hypothetical protein
MLCALAAPAAAQGAGQATANQFTLADGRISFQAPPGFTLLSAQLLAAKYPNGGAPRQAVSNPRATTSIAFDLQDQRLPTSDLQLLRKVVMNNFAQLPKLTWIANDVRRVGSREWAYLEFTAAAADQDIHNIVLVSVHDSRLLVFNFNSTVTEFLELEPALRASMASISVKP